MDVTVIELIFTLTALVFHPLVVSQSNRIIGIYSLNASVVYTLAF
jgi:hypothetical protein